MRLSIFNIPITPNTWYSLNDLSQLQLTWDPTPGSYYTFIIYDIDAPYPSAPHDSPFIHLLITNILGSDISKGTVLIEYLLPNPLEDSQLHRYQFSLYRQTTLIPNLQLPNRSQFPLNSFISQNGLELISNETIVVNPSNKQFYLAVSSISTEQRNELPITINSRYPLLIANTQLDQNEQAYCSCVAKVATRQPGQCNLEKAWFEMRDGRECYNPFAVCAASVGTSSRRCYENYNYEAMDDEQLASIAGLRNVRVSTPLNRSALIYELTSEGSS